MACYIYSIWLGLRNIEYYETSSISDIIQFMSNDNLFHDKEEACRSSPTAAESKGPNLAYLKFVPDALMIHIRHANTMKWYGSMTGPQF
jgi:hypothetical protein